MRAIDPPARSGLPRHVRRSPLYAGVGLTLLGAAVIAGWALGVEALKTPVPGTVTMKLNTAIGFVCVGVALIGAHTGGGRWASAAAAAAGAIGLFSVTQDLFGFELGIDELLVSEDPRPTATGRAGRMSPYSATAFVLLSAAVLGRARPRASQRLALLTLGIGALSLLGHAYRADDLVRVRSLTAVAVHTSFGILVAAAGVLFLAPTYGVPAALLDSSAAGQQLRRQLPIAILLPIVAGALALAGSRSSSWDPGVEAAIVAIASMAILLGVAAASSTPCGAPRRSVRAVPHCWPPARPATDARSRTSRSAWRTWPRTEPGCAPTPASSSCSATRRKSFRRRPTRR